MLIRTKSGEMLAANGAALLEFLDVKKGASGLQKVAGDVEIIAAVPFQLTAGEEATKSYPWVLSTYDLDRFGERIDPAGWDIQRFLLNPVVEWSHNFMIPAIGKIEGLAVDDTGLHGAVIFNDKSFDPFGWGIGQRVQAGVIRAGSVGFRVSEIEIPDKETAKDGTMLIFRKQELLEFSICNVPANPYALAKTNNKEQITENKDNGGNTAVSFWDCLINNQQGV